MCLNDISNLLDKHDWMKKEIFNIMLSKIANFGIKLYQKSKHNKLPFELKSPGLVVVFFSLTVVEIGVEVFVGNGGGHHIPI